MWANVSFFFIAIVFVKLALASPALESRAVGFAADPSINAKGIFNTAKKGKKVLATFPSGSGSDVKIFGDWQNLHGGVSAIPFIADMDVDCDGVFFRCPHSPDGQPKTSFGHLDASKVPYFVIPETFFQSHRSQIEPNALGAIICGGRMFYGIMADTNGDSPEVIGEASILMAQTCFPNEGLDGGTGHSQADVLYVVFGNKVPGGVGDKTINIGALKTLGDQEAKKLASALGV